MRIIRFNYTRTRRGVLFSTRWFAVRFYLPVLPRWDFWWK